MGWYAIFVETGKEEVVCAQISRILDSTKILDCELFIPKRKMKERCEGRLKEKLKIMFPGYVLVRTEHPHKISEQIRKVNRLYHFLTCEGIFQEISFKEIENIIIMSDNNGIIGISDVYVDNDKIIVLKGPLMNYQGVIKKVDRRHHRVKVLFEFGETYHYVSLSVNIIEKKESSLCNEIPFINNSNIYSPEI